MVSNIRLFIQNKIAEIEQINIDLGPDPYRIGRLISLQEVLVQLDDKKPLEIGDWNVNI